MFTNSLFSLQYISKVPYLLPFGQLIVDQYKGVKINETGVFIWNAINQGCHDFDSLLAKCIEYFEAEPDEIPEITKDIRDFVDFLKALNIILNSDNANSTSYAADDTCPAYSGKTVFCRTFVENSTDSNETKICNDKGADSIDSESNNICNVNDTSPMNYSETIISNPKCPCDIDSTKSNSSSNTDICAGYVPANIHHLNIAGILLDISAPEGTFTEEFSPFEINQASYDSLASKSLPTLSIQIHILSEKPQCQAYINTSTNVLSEKPQCQPYINTSTNSELSSVASDNSSSDKASHLHYSRNEQAAFLPSIHNLATHMPIIKNDDLEIFDLGDAYYFNFPASKKLICGHLNKSGTEAHLYCLPPDEFDLSVEVQSIYERLRELKVSKNSTVSQLPEDESPEPRLKDDIFHAIRLLFLYTAHKFDRYMLHSASILYQNRAWLFSATSGTGKSTHTNLWTKLYGTPQINGDLNLFTIENGVPVVKGTPWCGTSGVCDPATYPLGGIILLKRGLVDHVEELTEDEKRLLVLQRLISPTWDKNLLNKSINFLENVADNILVCRLLCTKEDSAAICMKEKIDSYLSQLQARSKSES